jgi:hypothetical protein
MGYVADGTSWQRRLEEDHRLAILGKRLLWREGKEADPDHSAGKVARVFLMAWQRAQADAGQ